jgi:hypothetical protein
MIPDCGPLKLSVLQQRSELHHFVKEIASTTLK